MTPLGTILNTVQESPIYIFVNKEYFLYFLLFINAKEEGTWRKMR